MTFDKVRCWLWVLRNHSTKASLDTAPVWPHSLDYCTVISETLSCVCSVGFYTFVAKFSPCTFLSKSELLQSPSAWLAPLVSLKTQLCRLGIECCCFRLEARGVRLPSHFSIVLIQGVTPKTLLSCWNGTLLLPLRQNSVAFSSWNEVIGPYIRVCARIWVIVTYHQTF